MRVQIFDVTDDGKRGAIRGEADLASVMGDDLDGAECVEAQLAVQGVARIGGGAAPLIELALVVS